MSTTRFTLDDFDRYFHELHGHPPYPWQRRLAERALRDDWPGAVDLPTGSGKTACLDIAVFSLAAQAARPIEERVGPRRIFFCVNRRVIVDEAHQRARRIATALWEAERGEGRNRPLLRTIAANLREIAGTEAGDGIPPLDVLELRGGIHRDNRWARSITQPTIVCTTLDQLGSRLLFRGYGVSAGAAPIHAALIAHDSLILLDEAHISEPFRQTLEWVVNYLDHAKWAEAPTGAEPFTVVPMTATPNDAMKARGVIELEDDDRDPELPLLRRLEAAKPAELRETRNLPRDAARAAMDAAREQPAAVGIIVNRVATARAIHAELIQAQAEPHSRKWSIPEDVPLELVIGSMRPIDRDQQTARLAELVGPERPAVTARTSFIIATQCLEVGADYDFDVLITECASLDALRQRFGRLNRAGRAIDSRAVIFTEAKNIKPEEKLDDEKPLDPIYGNALARTWHWLTEHATETLIDEEPRKVVDFGIDAFNALIKEHGEADRPPMNLLAPSASLDAPVLMPAYLDLWCQTAPQPATDPDVSLFIHGPQGGEPDVQVCWRCDLARDAEGNHAIAPHLWTDLVALLPPTSAECMRLPLSRMRRWLNDTLRDDTTGDAMGAAEADASAPMQADRRIPTGVLWRGGEASTLLRTVDQLKPGDTVVLPVDAERAELLGHLPESASRKGQAGTITDHAEAAYASARDRVALRLHPALRHRLPPGQTVDDLVEAADRHNAQRLTIREWADLLRRAAKVPAASETDADPTAGTLRSALAHLADTGFRIEPYPDRRGVVLTGRQPLRSSTDWFLPPTDDGEDAASATRRTRAVRLDDHTRHVLEHTRHAIALQPLNPPAALFERAATLHDLGKADERFQAMLRRTDRTDAWLLAGVASALLAKSDAAPLTPAQQRKARERAGLPPGFRHEMLSVQLAELSSELPDDEHERALLLHLIAAHHGYARPFAPVVPDDELPAVEAGDIELTHEQRARLTPPHRIDSGVAERFWQLTRRYGWWGLPYLEAVLRLADQQASAAEDADACETPNAREKAELAQ